MTSRYFSFQARLTRLRNTDELLPWEYGRELSPGEYRQVLDEPFGQTTGWEAERYEVITQRLKNLLISKRLYATESCQ
jgi:hypothetical protein